MLRIHGLLDDDVVVLAAPIDAANVASLTPAEAQRVERAVGKRRHEFATGRALARAALSQLGRAPAEILSGPDRAPLWPNGVYGSISHSDHVAVVAVTESARVGHVGIDIEQPRELERELWSRLFLPAELAQLDRALTPQQQSRLAVTLFSAKEAFYKAQYAQTLQFLDFHAVYVELTSPSGPEAMAQFRCTFQSTVGPFAKGKTVQGRYLWDSHMGSILTAVSIPVEPA